MLAVTALLIFVVLLVKKKVALSRNNVLPILLWTTYTCVFFLPSMHERYGFFIELAAVLLAIVNIRSIWISALMIMCTLPKYLYAVYLCGNPLWLQTAEAAINTFVYLLFTCILWNRLFRRTANGNVEAQNELPEPV